MTTFERTYLVLLAITLIFLGIVTYQKFLQAEKAIRHSISAGAVK